MDKIIRKDTDTVITFSNIFFKISIVNPNLDTIKILRALYAFITTAYAFILLLKLI